jgi:PAS domain S-box-containing protein
MSPLDRDRVAAARRVAASAVGVPGLQRLTHLAARLLRAPSAGVSVVDSVQTVAGSTGRSAVAVGAEIPAADSLGMAVIAAREPLVVPDTRADARLADLPRVRAGEVVSYLGVPLVGTGGHVVGVLAVFGPEERAWSEADVALLAELAESAVTELELSAVTSERETDRLRWGLAIDAAGIGGFDWDLVTGGLSWDDRMIELFGYERAELSGTLEDFTRRLHPDDRERVSAALQLAMDTCGVFEQEYRLRLPAGEIRWVQSRGRAVPDAGGNAVRFLGAAYDTTRSRHADAQVARVLESMPAAFFSLGRDWTFTYVNVEAEKLLAADRDQLIGGDIWELFPSALDSTFETQYRGAMASGQPTVFQAYYPPPLDSWYEVRVWPTAEGLSVYFLDITERRAAEERARRSTERLALIAEVTAGFSTSLDGGGRTGVQALATLARAVVPVLGDWAIVSVVEEDGRLRDVASWHWDPDTRGAAARYAQLRLAALTSTAPLVAALQTGEAIMVADVPAAVGRTLPPGEVRTVFDRLAPQTAVALPLNARGRIVGALSVYRSADRPAADAEDIATLQEIADRAALALDNLQLYEQQRGMAAELQRSLLTDPVQPDHAQIAVRYSPAQRAAQVGGDWYDAFLQPDGATMLVIGDVVGHDTVAAAAMGQLRGLLRGIAFRSGAGPAEVLSDLDRAVQGLEVHTLATAAIARFEQDDEQRSRGETRLRWSSAGHPPLLVLDPDGEVSVLAGERADLLLGVDPSLPRREHELVLVSGSTVLLYTDGLVEGRDEELDAGIERLRGLFAELGPLPLDELCDGLVERLRPGGSEDDVALVAIRLHREDRPRPLGAGPGDVPPGR